MKKFFYLTTLAFVCSLVLSCEKIEEEPEINLGYESDVRVADPEELTDADKAAIQAQKDEYATNAK